jgi:uncharacterized protein (DUF305 family)
MTPTPRRRVLVTGTLFVALATFSVLGGGLHAQTSTPAKPDYTPADVKFMQGMIVHHAQAVVMSNWAESHGARADVLTLCKRIALSQYDEIGLMQRWLEARHLPAPDPLYMQTPHTGPVHDTSPMNMPGMNMGNPPMMMSGMLSPAEMRALDAAHGIEFDRLYLTGMMKHHQGAVDMVAALFATAGGGQQPELFGFATDIDAGQRVEIARMQAMLKTLPTTPSPTR